MLGIFVANKKGSASNVGVERQEKRACRKPASSFLVVKNVKESNDAFVIRSSSPIYRIGEPWGSFLPSGEWPIALEVEYAVET